MEPGHGRCLWLDARLRRLRLGPDVVRRGAGVLLVARETGRILLLRRSRTCSEPGTWAVPGGKVDQGENARTTAIRELEEEAGWYGPVTVLKDPIFVFEAAGLEFLTYFGFVDGEFEPQINEESSDWGWFSLGRLPIPLHFGVDALMRERRKSISTQIARIPQWPH